VRSIAEAPPKGIEPGGVWSVPSARPFLWIFTASALVLAGLVTAAIIFLTNYDPLCHGPCTGSGGVQGISGVKVEDLGHFTSPTGFNFSAVRVSAQEGGRFRFLFTLSNQGPIGVTITQIGPGPETEERGLPYVNVTMAAIGGPEQPFRPFWLGGRGREFVDIWVTVRMKGCVAPDTSMGVSSVPIAYRVLGFTRHTNVYLPETVDVVGAAGETCTASS